MFQLVKPIQPYSGVVSASDRFGRYKPESQQPVRSLQVSDELDQLRAKRYLLRKMTPDQALSVIEFHENLTFFEAVALAKKEGKIIVPHDVIDRILTETVQRLPFTRSGTLVIYEAPNEAFGKTITKNRVSFTIPKQFRGRVNCALVVDYPDFDIIALKNKRYQLKADETRIHVIDDFPKKCGWYQAHTETKIPHGVEVSESLDARRISRFDSSYIGASGPRRHRHLRRVAWRRCGRRARLCVRGGVVLI